MSLVVMGDALDVIKAHRQQGLRTFQGLHLALLIDAQDQRLVRRIQREPHNVAQLLDEERVGGELKGFATVGRNPNRCM